MKKKVLLAMILLAVFLLIGVSEGFAQKNEKKDYQKLIIGKWAARLPDKTELVYAFKEDRSLTMIHLDKDGKIKNQKEIHFTIKKSLILTFLRSGERFKAWWIKSLSAQKMEIVDITDLQKNGDLTPILEMLEDREINLSDDKIITFYKE